MPQTYAMEPYGLSIQQYDDGAFMMQAMVFGKPWCIQHEPKLQECAF